MARFKTKLRTTDTTEKLLPVVNTLVRQHSEVIKPHEEFEWAWREIAVAKTIETDDGMGTELKTTARFKGELRVPNHTFVEKYGFEAVILLTGYSEWDRDEDGLYERRFEPTASFAWSFLSHHIRERVLTKKRWRAHSV